MATIEERLYEIIAESLSVEKDDIKSDSSFIDDLDADSLDVVEMIMAMESEFSPLIRITLIPPSPGGVANAAMVSLVPIFKLPGLDWRGANEKISQVGASEQKLEHCAFPRARDSGEYRSPY